MTGRASAHPFSSIPTNIWLVAQESPATQRQDRYTPASVKAHPGKMLPSLARRLIESYTRPAEWILDPLSGIGTTGVEAVHLGRHYVGIELEPRFAAHQRQNLERAREQGATGRFTVYRGDARRLDASFGRSETGDEAGQAAHPPGPVHAVLTSPPYADRLRQPQSPSRLMQELIDRNVFRAEVIPGIYGSGADNLGNLAEQEFLEQMRFVYGGCYQALRPGGILALVLQAGRREHRLRPLHHQTVRLCQEIGFDFIDEIIALLARVEAAPGKPARVIPHARFWRWLTTSHLRERGYPVTLNQVEYVLVFRKPDELPLRRRRARAPEGLAYRLRIRKSDRQAALAGCTPYREG